MDEKDSGARFLDEEPKAVRARRPSVHEFEAVEDGAVPTPLAARPSRSSFADVGADVPGGPRRSPSAKVSFAKVDSMGSAIESAAGQSDPGSSSKESYSTWRVICRRVVGSKAFDATIYSCIALNTVVIAMNDFYARRNRPELNLFFEFTDWFVLIVFTIEMILKMYAWGLGLQRKPTEDPGEGTGMGLTLDRDEEIAGYFSSKWNTFDAIVVVVSWTTAPLIYAAEVSTNAARFVRAVRTVRPLRALRSFEGTQDVLMTFPAAFPAMRDGIKLLCFVFVVFSILGVNLFGVEGTFHGRCVVDKENPFGTKGMLQKERDDEVLCGYNGCSEGFRCSCKPAVFSNGTVESRPWAFMAPETLDRGCLEMEPERPWELPTVDPPRCPDYGFTCFNNFAIAFLTCFKIITLDNWTRTMWWAQDTLHPAAWIYFLSLIFLVSFNIVNLYVAGISTSYLKVRETRLRTKKLREKMEKGLKSQQSMESGSQGQDDESKAESEEAPFYMKILEKLRPARKKLNGFSHSCRKVVLYPLEIDETGAIVQDDILMLAAERNLDVCFGPELGQWRVVPRACAVVDDDNNAEHSNLFCNGRSMDPDRKELREKLLSIAKDESIEGESDADFQRARAPWLDIGILICIAANTVTMASEHYAGTPVSTARGFLPEDHCCNSDCTWRDSTQCPRGIVIMPLTLFAMLDSAETIFCIIFSSELLIKVVSLESLMAYIFENFPFNLLDLVVVVVSDALLIASFYVKTNNKITVLRLLRILRVFRLVSGFRRLHSLLGKAISALVSINYVLFVLVFWHVVGALLAMQMFSCEMRRDKDCQMINGTCPEGCSDLVGNPTQCVFSQQEIFDNCPWDQDINFNTFLDGIVVLLFVTTGESWSAIMGNGMRSYSSVWPGIIFFVSFHVISFFMLYNLFISVILQEFELTESQKEASQLGMFRVRILKEIKMMRIKQRDNAEARALGLPIDDEEVHEGSIPGLFFESVESQKNEYDEDTPIFFGLMRPPTPNDQFPDDPKNLRAYVRTILLNVWFDRLILLTILVSAASLALESPIPEYSLIDPEIGKNAEFGFVTLFGLEFILKIMDRGILWESKRAYFRSSWNCLDFTILTFQLIDVLEVSNLSTVRIFRLLRPLRLLNKVKSLQLLLMAMQACAVDVMNVLLLWLFAFIIFSILGVSLFSGKLMSCNDGDFVGGPLNPSEAPGSLIGWRENCVGNFYTTTNDRGDAYVAESMATPVLMPRVWANPVDSASDLGFSFDNFGASLQTLFEVATFEQWTSVVFALQATTSVGQQPIPKISAISVLYLHVWVVLSCFFLLQLVIGVLVDAINQKNGQSLLTTLQRNWVQIETKLFKLKPMAKQNLPKSKWQAAAWRIVNMERFQQMILFVITLNIFTLATEGYDNPPELALFVRNLDYTFVAFYCLEICLKLFAYGISFFNDVWNLFDFAVVAFALTEITYGSASGLTAVRVIRVVRVVRTVRLVRHVGRLRLIIIALMRTLPHIMSALVLLMLCTFLFAVLGVQVFSGVKAGFGVHRRNNFKNAFNACLLLLRVITGEDWQVVVRDCGIDYPLCTSDAMAKEALDNPFAKGDCGNPIVAYLYFDSFFIFGNSILLNLFIAVLLENFFTLQSSFLLSDQHLESFQRAWRDVDKLGRGKISVWDFRQLVEKLHHDGNPLGSCTRVNQIKLRSVRVELIENSKDGELAFQDVAMTLAMHVVGSHGLKYAEMLKRQERLAYFAYIATVSKMTSLFQGKRSKRLRESGYEEDDMLLERLIDQETKKLVELQRANHQKALKPNDNFEGVQFASAPALVEICLASLPEGDLERAILDLESMLSSVHNDRFIANISSALQQLTSAHLQRPSVWPHEQPSMRAFGCNTSGLRERNHVKQA